MQKRTFRLLLVGFTGLIFLTAGASMAVEVPDDVKIENKGYKKDRKGPVNLSHKAHTEDYAAACTDCHHDYQDGKNVWQESDPVKKCAECHDPQEKQEKAYKLRNAYHRNCKICHRDKVKAGESEDAPYRKCTACHA